MCLQTVYAVYDYFDGPRVGIADFETTPHVFRSEWNAQLDDRDESYMLKPLAEDEFVAVMAEWAIWVRWLEAYRTGTVTRDTHPALPEDKLRHEEIAPAVEAAMTVDPESAIRARAVFEGRVPPDGELRVRWTRCSR